MQFFGSTVFNNFIRYTEDLYIILVTMLRHKFQDRTAKSSFYCSIFNGNDLIITLQRLS